MRIHFASGTHPFPKPWINVDLYCPADLAVDLTEELPATLTGITRAYVGHYLEHVTPKEAARFLGRIRDRMTPGGDIHVIGPDVDKAERFHRDGVISAYLREHIGRCIIPNDTGGESHYWDCSGRAVKTMLEKTGWCDVTELPISQLPADIPMIDPAGWQFYVTAISSRLTAGHAALDRAIEVQILGGKQK